MRPMRSSGLWTRPESFSRKRLSPSGVHTVGLDSTWATYYSTLDKTCLMSSDSNVRAPSVEKSPKSSGPRTSTATATYKIIHEDRPLSLEGTAGWTERQV